MNTIWVEANKYTQGRKGVKYIVIHWVGEGTGQSAVNWFASKNNKVSSAHYVVEDNTVWQCVREGATAWAVGVWEINQWSISIEHSATPKRPASEATYQTSAKLVKEICERYGLPINRDTIKGHNEFKNTACPGTININKIINLAKGSEDIVPDYLKNAQFYRVNNGETIFAVTAIPNPTAWQNDFKQPLEGMGKVPVINPEFTKKKDEDAIYTNYLVPSMDYFSFVLRGDIEKVKEPPLLVPKSDLDDTQRQIKVLEGQIGLKDAEIEELKKGEEEIKKGILERFVAWLKTIIGVK